jgi:Fe-S-cluster-containing hydrogenase component 2
VIVGSECTACADCLAACPQGAIELTGYGHGQVRTLPYVRQVAFVLLLAFFVFYTVFLLKTYVPLFGAS